MTNIMKLMLIVVAVVVPSTGFSETPKAWAPYQASPELAAANTLLAVTVREVSHPMAGDPDSPPAADASPMAYAIRFDVREMVPSKSLYELKLEGLSTAQWMPGTGARGFLIITMSASGDPIATTFPGEGFYPLKPDAGGLVELPIYSENMISKQTAWDLLSTVVRDKSAAGSVLREGLGQGTLAERVARMYLLQLCPVAPENESSATACLKEAYETCATMMTAENTDAPALFERILRAAWPLLGAQGKWSVFELCRKDVLLERPVMPPRLMFLPLFETAMAQEAAQKKDCLFYLFSSHVYPANGNGTNRRRYLSGIQDVQSTLLKQKDPVLDTLMFEMAQAPTKFEGFYGVEDLAVLWKLLASRKLPEFRTYLERIASSSALPDLAQPPNTTQIKSMTALAGRLLSDWDSK